MEKVFRHDYKVNKNFVTIVKISASFGISCKFRRNSLTIALLPQKLINFNSLQKCFTQTVQIRTADCTIMRHFFSESPNSFREVPAFPPNRAMLFGDGIFETMVYIDGEIRFEQLHQERLLKGMRALMIQSEELPEVKTIASLVANQVGKTGTFRLRWTVFRAGLGKYTPTDSGYCELLTVAPFHPATSVKKTAYISDSIRVPYNSWANCKTLNALPYVMANLERQKKQQEEVILLDQNGYLSEAGSANLFWQKEGIFYTPSLRHACVAGVARRQILIKLQEMNLTLIEGSFRPDDLLQAEQVFVSNVSGISYLEQIQGISFATQPVPGLAALFGSSTNS